MADYAIPKSGVAYIFYGCLVSQADTKLFKSAPTIAAGDFKVSIDGGAFANLATLPTNTPGTFSVKFSLSAGEMTGDNILVVASDAAGAEWCDQSWNIQTSARGVADLAYPTVSGRSLDVTATGAAGIDWANVENPTTALNLSATNIDVDQVVASVSGAVGSVTGNVGGNVVGSVASVTAGVTLAASAVQAIWDALTTALTTVGSIGKKLADWTIGTAQTGDSFARLGAPAGASVSADIAAVKVDTAAVKAKTDSLTFTVAGQADANIQSINDVTIVGNGGVTPFNV